MNPCFSKHIEIKCHAGAAIATSRIGRQIRYGIHAAHFTFPLLANPCGASVNQFLALRKMVSLQGLGFLDNPETYQGDIQGDFLTQGNPKESFFSPEVDPRIQRKGNICQKLILKRLNSFIFGNLKSSKSKNQVI